MNLANKLNAAYPRPLNRWRTIVFISLFIGFFLVIFQPFGLQFVQITNKRIILGGYGLVTFSVMLSIMLLGPILFPATFADDKWTVKKQVYYQLVIVGSIAIGNYLYSVAFSVIPWIGFKGFLIFAVFTFLIAILPIVAIAIISQNIYLKQNIAQTKLINSELNNKTPQSDSSYIKNLVLKSGTRQYKFLTDTILYMESEGNYVKVYYLKDGGIKSQLIRNTIKNIESELESPALIKCHRAFIINLNFIEKVKGNSQGYSINIKHTNTEIPVSRTYTRAFRDQIQGH